MRRKTRAAKKPAAKAKSGKKSANVKAAKPINRMKAPNGRKSTSVDFNRRGAFRPITKDMSLGEVIQRFPQTFPVFARYGIHCIGCSMSAFETIEQGVRAHGIDVKKFVDDLNKAAEKGK